MYGNAIVPAVVSADFFRKVLLFIVSGFRIQDSGFRIQDSGFRIQDL